MTDAHKVLIIACGGTKHATPAGAVPAIDLYAGRQFALARKLAAHGWSVVIMSAQHGLVPYYKKLESYDCPMTAKRSAAAVRNVQTGRSVGAALFHSWTHDAARVVFYGGANYSAVFDALVTATGIARADSGCEVESIVGAGCGDHFSVLKRLVSEVEAEADAERAQRQMAEALAA